MAIDNDYYYPAKKIQTAVAVCIVGGF